MQKQPYICPICTAPLIQEKKRWYCQNNHSFDVAKQGYINLLPVQHKKSKQPGDAAAMVAARQEFLTAGCYAPLKNEIINLVNATLSHTLADNTHLLDIGCGEGYYTQGLSPLFTQCTAVDISKSAVLKTAKLKLANTHAIVASASQLPITDNCITHATSIFSPILPKELARVICTHGSLLVAKPAANHLMALRNLLFDDVTLHNSDKFIEQLSPYFSLVSQQKVGFDMQLNQTQLQNLIAMTPYAYKAKPKKRAEAESIGQLGLGAHFELFLFKKEKTS